MNQNNFIISTSLPEDYNELLNIWESSVKSTHDFLKEEDFINIKNSLIPEYFPQVDLIGLRDEEGKLVAFMGIAGNKLEMLFVHGEARGMGIGKKLLTYAIKNCSVSQLDVNEQNRQAVGFYEKFGFEVYKRTELDEQGKPYPLLKMRLKS